MSRFPNIHQIVSALIFIIVSAQLSHATAVVTVDQSGVIYGNGMDGVAGIELIINYDSSNLSTPSVTKGSLIPQSMLAANTSLPGVIRVAIISTSPFSGSGQIATIKFTSNTGKGWIKLVSYSMIDNKGVKVSESITEAQPEPTTQASTGTSTDTSTETSTGTSTGTSTRASTGTSTGTSTGYSSSSVPGSINFGTAQSEPPPASTETQAQEPAIPNYQKTAPQRTEPDSATSATAPPTLQPDTNARVSEPGQQIIYKGVLDRFKTYRGDKSLPFMVALFRKEISQLARQEPEIAVSDGKTRIRIIVDLASGHQTSPNFALDNAALISARKDIAVKGRWIIEALPEVAVWKATLSIIAGEESYEYPLTVAPPLGNSLKADQSGWNSFLKEIGTPQKPLHDFNKDGLRDYIDEFIFVANHLTLK